MIAGTRENRSVSGNVSAVMKTLLVRLRAAIVVLVIGVLVACTPAGGASAPAGSTGTVPSTAPAASVPPAASQALPSASGRVGY
jgi:hypothetical protein